MASQAEVHGRNCLKEVIPHVFYRVCSMDHDVPGTRRIATGNHFPELDWNSKLGFKPEVIYVEEGTVVAEKMKRTRSRRVLSSQERKLKNKKRKALQREKKRMAKGSVIQK